MTAADRAALRARLHQRRADAGAALAALKAEAAIDPTRS